MNADYEVVIGLETHAELSTATKIYCSCKNEFGAPPNTNCCPVCTGLPGALPVLNREAVHRAVKMGLACRCRINAVCRQDRKNYFYPDLPKAYQISQFDIPLCEDGYIEFIAAPDGSTKRVGIERIHIEEDAGKLVHSETADETLIDYNRCGVPLIEIVSRPDMRSSAEAKAYLDELKAILQALDISDCKMQEGSVRCDVNVSVRKRGETALSTRVEMKNVNSFSAVVRAIEFEAARQITLIKAGREIHQETRRWDDERGESFVLRTKENAQDYRFFPEPDIPPIVLTEDDISRARAEICELPSAYILRLVRDYSIDLEQAQLLYVNVGRADMFEAAVSLGASEKAAANWLNGEIASMLALTGEELTDTLLTAKELASLLLFIREGRISHTAGKTVCEELLHSAKTAEEIIAERGLLQVSDEGELSLIVSQVISDNEKAVLDYRKGKGSAIGFLLGQCMRRSKGRGDPKVFSELLFKALNN